jgi:TolA-binding protein
MRNQIRKRPVLWLAVTTVVALLLGVGIGGAGQGGDSGSTATAAASRSDLEAELAEAEDRLADAEDRLAATEDRLAEAEGARDQAETRSRTLRRQLRQTRRRMSEETSTDEQEASNGGDGPISVGDFTVTDVQVRGDSLGDFAVRARVENTGGPADFVSLQATLFNEGSVVATAEALEEFDAGQTRTITFITTDEYAAWDDIEFTIDD